MCVLLAVLLILITKGLLYKSMRKLYEKAINYIHIVDEETRDRYKRKFMWYDNGLLPLDARKPYAYILHEQNSKYVGVFLFGGRVWTMWVNKIVLVLCMRPLVGNGL